MFLYRIPEIITVKYCDQPKNATQAYLCYSVCKIRRWSHTHRYICNEPSVQSPRTLLLTTFEGIGYSTCNQICVKDPSTLLNLCYSWSLLGCFDFLPRRCNIRKKELCNEYFLLPKFVIKAFSKPSHRKLGGAVDRILCHSHTAVD